jgi:hypothetical protein
VCCQERELRGGWREEVWTTSRADASTGFKAVRTVRVRLHAPPPSAADAHAAAAEEKHAARPAPSPPPPPPPPSGSVSDASAKVDAVGGMSKLKLRSELAERSLSFVGLKNELAERLKAAIRSSSADAEPRRPSPGKGDAGAGDEQGPPWAESEHEEWVGDDGTTPRRRTLKVMPRRFTLAHKTFGAATFSSPQERAEAVGEFGPFAVAAKRLFGGQGAWSLSGFK